MFWKKALVEIRFGGQKCFKAGPSDHLIDPGENVNTFIYTNHLSSGVKEFSFHGYDHSHSI